MRPQPKYRVGDILKPDPKHGFNPLHKEFVVGKIYWNGCAAEGGVWNKEGQARWCYLPRGEKPDFLYDGMEEEGAAPYNSWWEGYLELVKRKVIMEENE